MYRRLRAEITYSGMSFKKFAESVGLTERALRNRIDGNTDFTLEESQRIKEKLTKSPFTLEELFAREG